MSKLPAIQFYPGDWRKDPGVQALGYFERGVWFEILCILWESEQRGKLLLNGKKMPEEALARLLGLETEKCKQILSKLVDYGVAKIEPETGIIYNARMVRDEEIRSKRKEAGKKGGNPNLLKQKTSKRTAHPDQMDFLNETPSSSVSVSTSASKREEDKTVSMFFEFAKKTHAAIRSSTLLIDREKDTKRVQELMQSVGDPEQLLEAWMLFLQSSDPYLVQGKKPRNIAVFKGQVSNYLEPAANALKAQKRKSTAPPPAPPPRPVIDRVEARRWGRVLKTIETEILPENFHTWIDPLRFGGVHKDIAVIYCPGKSFEKTVEENFSELIEQRLSAAFKKPLKVQFLSDTG